MRFLRQPPTVIMKTEIVILVYQLSAVFFLLGGYDADKSNLNSALIMVICIPMLLHRGLLVNPFLWLTIFVITLTKNLTYWDTTANHQFLIAYWALALGVAAASHRVEKSLAWMAQSLIGLVFAFAIIWKLRTGEYDDGAFFYFFFLRVERFSLIPLKLGMLEPFDINAIKAIWSSAGMFPCRDALIDISTSARLHNLSLICCYWTLFIEGAVAITFLLRKPQVLCNIRDYLLLIFIVSTYVLSPFDGHFGLILALMGIAQCPLQASARQWAYLCAFVVLPSATYVYGLKVEWIGQLLSP